jgi:hypothetical protein
MTSGTSGDLMHCGPPRLYLYLYESTIGLSVLPRIVHYLIVSRNLHCTLTYWHDRTTAHTSKTVLEHNQKCMAAMSTPNSTALSSSTTTPQPSQAQTLNPSRSPLPLSASQEGQVRELYYKNVRNKCKDEVRGIYTPKHLPLVDYEIPMELMACTRFRSMRHKPHIHSNFHVSAPASRYEYLYELLRYEGRAGRS